MRKPQQRPSRRVVLGGLATVLVFVALVARFWHPVYGFTAFFQLDASNDAVKLAAFKELPVYVYRDTGGYDGLYYAQIALDPSLRDPALPAANDNLSYRARRILPAVVAWVLGAGRPAGVVFAYSVLNIVTWLALAALLWRALPVTDSRGWLAWSGVLFSAGALGSVRLALTDLLAATLLTAAISAAERMRKYAALGSLAAAALSRETSVLGVAGLVKPPWLSLKNAARLAIAVVPLLAWIAYIRLRLGAAEAGWGNLDWPIVGFLQKWRDSLAAPFRIDDAWLAWTSLFAVVGLTVQAAYVVLHRAVDHRWWRVGVAFVGLMLCLGTPVWEGFPGAATRVLLPLTVAFNVLAHRARAALVWLLLGNLSVFAGLLALRDVPTDRREIAAVRAGSAACIVRNGTGWYDREVTARHAWTWAREAGTLELETWPKSSARLRLSFDLRGLTPRSVVLTQDGLVVWQREIGVKREHFDVDLTVSSGHAILRFASAEPPARESADAKARELGFALYDVTVAIPNP